MLARILLNVRFNAKGKILLLFDIISALETLRIIVDLTTCYKLMNNFIDSDSTKLLVASTSIHTTGNSRKLTKNHIPNISDANMFHNPAINFWDELPDSVVSATSICSFKRRLVSFMENVGS